MEISEERYRIVYDSESATITCEGLWRFSKKDEYDTIIELLNTVADQTPEIITLDLRSLLFLNSSGRNTLSRFIIRVRKLQKSHLVILATYKIQWQERVLTKLFRLMPSLELKFE